MKLLQCPKNHLPPLLSPPHPNPPTSLKVPSFRPTRGPRPGPGPIRAAGPSSVEMVQDGDGVWSSASEKRDRTVVVLWDLDNKPPRGPPYEAALSLRQLASLFGRVVDVAAYANRHAFLHLPQWVLDQRRQRKAADEMERKGLSVPLEPYVCTVCGRKCRTHADLRKHFRQLHQREREKKLARMRSLKGKKRINYRERFISGNTKYDDAARELIKPRAGYGLGPELRRAGVFVKTVEDKPQAADAALKRQVRHSVARGIDWLVLVSDDSDFTEVLGRAREAQMGTVVVGDWKTALGRRADLWFPWAGVENGEVGEELALNGLPVLGRDVEVSFEGSGSDSESSWSDVGGVVDEIVARAFSGDDDDVEGWDNDWDSQEEDDGFL